MKGSVRRVAATLAVAAALALTGCTEQGLSAGVTGDAAVQEFSGPARVVVDFTGTTTDGKAFRSEDHRGQVLVVNFWYAGCGPCRQETPELAAIATKYAGHGVQFVGVNVRDSSSDAAAFLKEKALPYPSIVDAGGGATQLAFARSKVVSPNAVPTTVVLDSAGRATARVSGLLQAPDILEGLIDTARGSKG